MPEGQQDWTSLCSFCHQLKAQLFAFPRQFFRCQRSHASICWRRLKSIFLCRLTVDPGPSFRFFAETTDQYTKYDNVQ